MQYKRSVDIFAAGLTFLAMIQPMGQNGMLTPRIEGGHISGELSNSIGLSMYNRKIHNQRQLTLVIEIGGNHPKANLVRRIIRQATLCDPSQRLTASQMHNELESLVSENSVSLEAVNESPEVSEPMEVSEHNIEVNGEVANADTIRNGAKAEPFTPSVPGREIMEISGKIAPSAMTQVGILFLEVEMTQIRIFQVQHRENVQMVNYDIETWVQNNPGPDARKKLYGLLSQASKKGLISPDAYSCLLK